MCSCHLSTHLPSPEMRTARKMASHSFSIAASSGRSGNTFFAQLGMGMEAMHQGNPPHICRRSKSFSAAPLACWARTMRPWSTPLRFSGSLAEMARYAAPSRA